MAQWLTMLTALAEDLDQFPRVHMCTTDSSSRESDALLWHLEVLGHMWCT